MFTGIIQSLGELVKVEAAEAGALRWGLRTPGLQDLELGESVSVNGCCLTVAALSNGLAWFDLSPETLKKTTASDRKAGDAVNLERALRVGDKMGGHFVAGHVDTVASVVARQDQGDGCEMEFECPQQWARFVADKGSVALDGVSLTPFAVSDNRFKVALIPHTLKETSLGDWKGGRHINMEVDLLARYVQRLMEGKA